MNYSLKKKSDPQDLPEAERRRIGQIARDERGNAFVDWRDAPADHERPVLEIAGEGAAVTLKKEEVSYDPYARVRATRELPKKPANAATRTDLRRLSEHIKLMRALEERKRNGDDDF